jgi:hypothetical protein
MESIHPTQSISNTASYSRIIISISYTDTWLSDGNDIRRMDRIGADFRCIFIVFRIILIFILILVVGIICTASDSVLLVRVRCCYCGSISRLCRVSLHTPSSLSEMNGGIDVLVVPFTLLLTFLCWFHFLSDLILPCAFLPFLSILSSIYCSLCPLFIPLSAFTNLLLSLNRLTALCKHSNIFGSCITCPWQSPLASFCCHRCRSIRGPWFEQRWSNGPLLYLQCADA